LDSINAKTEADSTKESTPAKAPTGVRRPSTVPLTGLPKQTDPDTTSSNAITDWYGQAHSVAEDALEKEQSKGAKTRVRT
jgi:hypothetical protein